MGAESARKCNRDKAKSVVESIGRILERVNRDHTPLWMMLELDQAYAKSQCIQGEFERVMKGYGDKI